MKKYCLALDLVPDEKKIAEYEAYHKAVWPEILKSIHDSGVTKMEIYRFGHRMFMIMTVTDDFSFEQKAKADADNPKVQEWETLMWEYQRQIPGCKQGEKWVLMDKIFETESTEFYENY